MSYIFCLKMRPGDDGSVKYQISNPGELKGISEAASALAKGVHGEDRKSTYRVIKLHMSDEDYETWRKENNIENLVSEETVKAFHSKNQEAFYENGPEDEFKLGEKVLEIFLASLSFNPAHSYSTNSSRKLLKDRYFAYLDGLESGKTTLPDVLIFQLKNLVAKDNIPHVKAIYQDISTGGKKHQKLLQEDSTCLERLKNTAKTNPFTYQQPPLKEIKSGISFWERNTIYYGLPPIQPINPEGIINTQGFENKPDRPLNANEGLVLAQLQAKGLNTQILINLYKQDEFSAHHASALLNLVGRGYPLIRALEKIDGLSPEQVEGISNGLEREEILELKTWWEGKALVELKHEGLTARMLKSRKSGGFFFEEGHYKTLKLLSERLTVWEALEKMDNLSSEDVDFLYQQELNEHTQPRL